ncbi:MAG: hypothetical protein EOP53_10530 [Sphingobacteriales bacterium]|nr:MAG: hypothetical protein EOP53_10530 [Sphingobacteriales bacterium]
MKKVLFVAYMAIFVGLSFGSCKKDHTCTCTDSDNEKQVVTYPDSKKKDAQKACDALDGISKAFDPTGPGCKLD